MTSPPALPHLDEAHPLFDLQTLHAVAVGRALLTARGEPDRIAHALREAGLPPEDATQVVDAEERPLHLELPVDGLDLPAALRLGRALSTHGCAWALLPRAAPGVRRAIDHGRASVELLASAGLFAARVRVEDRALTVRRASARFPVRAPELVELVAELRSAVQQRGGALPDDAVMLTVDRRDGRLGLWVAPTGVLPPQAWTAAAEVVHARAAHPALRLAPCATWDDRVGPELWLDLLVRPAPALPTPPPAPVRVSPPCGLTVEWEILAPRDAPVPEGTWEHDDREPTLYVDSHPITRLRGHRPAPGAAAAPALLAGLEEAVDDLSVDAWPAGPGWAIRSRDDLLDQDLVEVTTPREATDTDRRLLEDLARRLPDDAVRPDAAERWAAPVVDAVGRPGLALRLDGACATRAWATLVPILGTLLENPAVEPALTVAFGRQDLHVRLWYRLPGRPDLPRSWQPAP